LRHLPVHGEVVRPAQQVVPSSGPRSAGRCPPWAAPSKACPSIRPTSGPSRCVTD
jgi:hypothetical protein